MKIEEIYEQKKSLQIETLFLDTIYLLFSNTYIVLL